MNNSVAQVLRSIPAVFVCAMASFGIEAAPGASGSLLRSNDVVALVGGANIVSAQQYGYLETLLRIGLPQLNLRIRSLAHEGDTVYEQPRDYNYPTIEKQLSEYRATVVLAQFGQMEALQGTNRLAQFISAYDKLLTQLAQNGRRVALLSPIPIERTRPVPLVDSTARDVELREFVHGIDSLANRRSVPFIDLFSLWLAAKPAGELTTDSVHLNGAGHWQHDLILARALGAKVPSNVTPDTTTGALSRADWERIRQAVIEKNRLWFNYYRPMNWAFLNGDRTDQPSSRDPVNPKIRWFPDEMRKFEPMIDNADAEILALVSKGRQ